MICRGLAAAILSLLLTTSAIADGFVAVPGGVASIPLPSPFGPDWQLHWRKKPLNWRYVNDTPVGLLGIPLGFGDDQLEMVITDPDGTITTVTLPVADKQYREQRITLANNDYVAPKPLQLERIGREKTEITTALNHFSDQAPSSWRMQPPVAGRRSASFGLRRFFNDQPRRPHSGMDIAAVTGTPVLAPLSGKVIAVGDWYFNGKTVVSDHGRGLITLYCHLSVINAEIGQTFVVGKPLGAVGTSGRVTGAHLHWGVYLNGEAVDPAMFLAEPDLIVE